MGLGLTKALRFESLCRGGLRTLVVLLFNLRRRLVVELIASAFIATKRT
jgi:hypothetical protein